MLHPKTILCHMLLLLWGITLFPQPLLAQEELQPSSQSLYGTVLSVLPLENETHFSLFDGTQFLTLTATSSTPCLYQGQQIPLTQIQAGCRGLFSYAEQKISSILVLSLTSNQTTTSSVYGMYYNFNENSLWITLPGGPLKSYPLAKNVTYFVNNHPVTYPDFYRLTLPGDDIKVSLNPENEATQIEAYVTKNNEVAKTNPNLLQ